MRLLWRVIHLSLSSQISADMHTQHLLAGFHDLEWDFYADKEVAKTNKAVKRIGYLLSDFTLIVSRLLDIRDCYNAIGNVSHSDDQPLDADGTLLSIYLGRTKLRIFCFGRKGA